MKQQTKNKLKWAFIGIGLSLLFLGAVAVVVVGFVCGWDVVRSYASRVWHWLNAPLPIVSVSVIAICSFVLTIFVKSGWGKKNIAQVKLYAENTRAEYEATKVEIADKQKETESKLNEYKKVIETQQDIIKELCKTSRNKKVQELGASIPSVDEILETYVKEIEQELLKERDNG